jgi:hypothetical protein
VLLLGVSRRLRQLRRHGRTADVVGHVSVQAAAIVLPLLCDRLVGREGLGSWDYRRRSSSRGAGRIGAGALLFGTVSDETILVLVGTIAVVFT